MVKSIEFDKYAVLVFRTDGAFFGYWIGKNSKDPLSSLSNKPLVSFKSKSSCLNQLSVAKQFAAENKWLLQFRTGEEQMQIILQE